MTLQLSFYPIFKFAEFTLLYLVFSHVSVFSVVEFFHTHLFVDFPSVRYYSRHCFLFLFLLRAGLKPAPTIMGLTI